MHLKKVAEKSGVDINSVRFYMNKFKHYSFNQLDRNSYSAEMVEVIKFINSRINDNWPISKIQNSLDGKYRLHDSREREKFKRINARIKATEETLSAWREAAAARERKKPWWRAFA